MTTIIKFKYLTLFYSKLKVFVISLAALLIFTQVSPLSLAQAGNGSDHAGHMSEGPSDYRYASTSGSGSPTVTCTRFETKYVSDHVLDAKLKVHNGDKLQVFLRTASMNTLRGWGKYGEVAILLNGATNQKVVPANNTDYGRLVFYSERVKESVGINASFVPGIVVERIDGGTFLLSVTVVEFDSKGSPVLKSLLSGLSSVAMLAGGPATALASQVLTSLGNNFVTATSEGSRTLFHRIGFAVGNAEPKIRQPILREGDLVVVTKKDGTSVSWDRIFYNHRNGQLYLSPDCTNATEANAEYSYIVLTLRRGVARTSDELAQETLDSVITRAANAQLASSTMLGSITTNITTALSDYAVTKAANHDFESIRSPSAEVGKDALNMYLKPIWCSTAPAAKDAADCKDQKISNRKVLDRLRQKLLEEQILCRADTDAIEKADAAMLLSIVEKGRFDNDPNACTKPKAVDSPQASN